MTEYLDKPEQWEAVIRAIRARGIVGVDTETYGHNVKTSTPAFRAKIDVWSLALRTEELSPRGYHIARGCVLPVSSLSALSGILSDPRILKVFHNAHHDQHAFANHGILVSNVYDTLDAVRLLWPGNDLGYRIKSLRVGLLGKDEREGFKKLTAPLEVHTVFRELGQSCACGNPKCRKTERIWGDVHAKTSVVLEKVKVHKEPCPIESITPGHERWSRKLDYAGDDAVDALELHELCENRTVSLMSKLPELPW